MDYMFYSNFVRDAYSKLNGEVNTIVPSLDIVLDLEEKNMTAGSSIFSVTNIYLRNVLEKAQRFNLNEEEIKGYILFVIIHELSHSDQEVDMRRLILSYKDNIYRTLIEAENNVRTLCYMKNNEMKLRNLFGNFCLPSLAFNEFTEEVNTLIRSGIINSVSDLRYKQCKSIQDKILNTLNALFEQDIVQMYLTNRNIHSIFLRFVNEQRTELRTFHIIIQNVFSLGKEELRKACLIISNSLNYMRTTSIGFQGGVLNLIILLKEDNKALLNVVNMINQ